MSPRTTPVVAASVLALAALTYALSLNYYYFGRQTDDARHFLAAESLLKGRYVDAVQVGNPPRTNQLPGYPILILPAAALGSPRVAQWMSLCFVLAALGLMFWRWRADEAGWYAVALTAFHPLAVLAATSVMTEAPYLLLSLGVLQWAQALPEKKEKISMTRDVVVAAVLAGFCAWIRPQGAVLVLAAAWFLSERLAAKESRLFLIVSGALTLIPYARNFLVAHLAAGYFSELPTWNRPNIGAQLGSLASMVGSNLARYPLVIGRDAMLSWMSPVPGSDSWLASSVGWIVTGLTALGLWEFWRRKRADSLDVVYVVLYVGLHLFWIHRFPRYIFPVLPLLYRAFFRVIERRRKLLWAAAAILGMNFAVQDFMMIRDARTPHPGDNIPPYRTFAWIRQNVPQDAVIVTVMQDLIYYYTRRKTVLLKMMPDPDEWFMDILNHRAALLADYPVPGDAAKVLTVPVKVNPMVEALETFELRLRDTARFRKVCAVPGDIFVLYEIKNPERFEEGFDLLEKAKAAIHRGDAPHAYQFLKRAQAMGAPLVRLPFYLGTTAMILGRKREARADLKEAIRREPDFALARRNFEVVKK